MSKKKHNKVKKAKGQNYADVLEEQQSRRSSIYADIRQQIIVDGATLACNEVFHMGPGRAARFMESLINHVNEIAALFVGDDDPEMVYAKTKLDERLLKIVGKENFCPHDMRYGVHR